MIAIPAMDIIDKEVVRLVQGDYGQKQVYYSDPVELADKFRAAGVKRLHLVDLSGAKYGRPVHHDLFHRIKDTVEIPLQVGGGVRTLEHVRELFDRGLSEEEDQVMVGSLPFRNRAEFERIVDRFGSSIMVTLDVWDREVRISGWQEKTSAMIFDIVRELNDLGVKDYLITQIQRDGTMTGPDTELYQEVLQSFSTLRITASGGVSSLADLQQLSKLSGLTGVVVGRAFYEQNISLKELAGYQDDAS